MAQKRLNADGELVAIGDVEWQALRERLRAVLRTETGKKTPYLEALRHFVQE